MAHRACDRRKAYKRAIREHVAQGRINDANGNFRTANSSNETDKHMQAGYKVAGFARSRGR